MGKSKRLNELTGRNFGHIQHNIYPINFTFIFSLLFIYSSVLFWFLSPKFMFFGSIIKKYPLGVTIPQCFSLAPALLQSHIPHPTQSEFLHIHNPLETLCSLLRFDNECPIWKIAGCFGYLNHSINYIREPVL